MPATAVTSLNSRTSPSTSIPWRWSSTALRVLVGVFMPRSRSQRKLSRWEVLGAWLRLWTPPRDVDVPPVPWRLVGIGAAVLVVLGVLVVAVGIPEVRDHNRAADERERAADDARLQAR